MGLVYTSIRGLHYPFSLNLLVNHQYGHLVCSVFWSTLLQSYRDRPVGRVRSLGICIYPINQQEGLVLLHHARLAKGKTMAALMSKRQQARNERALQDLVQSVPGNNTCADCGARNPCMFCSADSLLCRYTASFAVFRKGILTHRSF